MKEDIQFTDLKSQYKSLKPKILARINRVLEHGKYIMGPEVLELEEKLSEYVGVKYCVSSSSGTDTLLIALLSQGIGRGDSVITPSFSYFAAGEMISLLGAEPILVDIDKRTFNIDVNKIEGSIKKNTKAIMPVSLFGQCPDMDKINEIAFKHNLVVIEDAAQSFGAKYKDRRSCGLSAIGSTSFFPSKPLGGYGDGGALFTDDENLAKEMREIRVHGQEKRYYHKKIGINGRLDTIQAAIILAKLERFDWEVEKRSSIGRNYTKLINEICPEIICPFIETFNSSVFAQYTIQTNYRDKVSEKLKMLGIPTSIHYPMPLHKQPAFKHLKQNPRDLDNCDIASRRVLSLPMSADLKPKDQKEIVLKLRKVLDECT